MASSVKPPRILLLVTLLILVTASIPVFFRETQLPESIPINPGGQPTLGFAKAPVHVVVFEEPKCTHCRELSLEIFPELKKEFIDTFKIKYTLIPVSFLPGSMPAAIAALCVYYENPNFPNDELFFKYFDYMYLHQGNENIDWATPQKLIEFARESSPAIQTKKLENCIDKETYRVKIEKNTAYGQELMGGTIATPTIYVDGMKVDEITLESIRKLIKEALEHKGVY